MPMSQPLRMVRSADLLHEREVLEEMLRSEGWVVFVRRVQKEWRGDGYFARMGIALRDADPLAAKVVHATSLEMERMIQWPKDHVAHLGGKTE